MSGAATTPIEILRSMTDHGKQKQLKNIRVCSIHTEFESPYSSPECEGVHIFYNFTVQNTCKTIFFSGIFRPMAFFISSNMRKCINEGRGDAVPIFLHDIPYVFERNVIPVDVSIISVRKNY